MYNVSGFNDEIGSTSPYIGLCGCSKEQPYRVNTLIVKSVGMLPGASAEYTSLSMNVQHIKNTGCIQFDAAHILFFSNGLNPSILW